MQNRLISITNSGILSQPAMPGAEMEAEGKRDGKATATQKKNKEPEREEEKQEEDYLLIDLLKGYIAPSTAHGHLRALHWFTFHTS